MGAYERGRMMTSNSGDARGYQAMYLPVSPRPVMVITSEGTGIGSRS